MNTTKTRQHRIIHICGECGYPRIPRKPDSNYCPFCGAKGSDLNGRLDAKIVKIGPLKEEFFQSLQGRKHSKGYRLQQGSGRRLERNTPQEDTMNVMSKDELARAKANREAVNKTKPKSRDLIPGVVVKEKAVKVIKKQEVKKQRIHKQEQKPAGTVFDKLRRKLGRS